MVGEAEGKFVYAVVPCPGSQDQQLCATQRMLSRTGGRSVRGVLVVSQMSEDAPGDAYFTGEIVRRRERERESKSAWQIEYPNLPRSPH